jgi:hypothetical protein
MTIGKLTRYYLYSLHPLPSLMPKILHIYNNIAEPELHAELGLQIHPL